MKERWSLYSLFIRACPRGVLLSDNYLLPRGVKAAFTEFFADKPEPVIALTGDQCMIVKLGEGLSAGHLNMIRNALPGERGKLLCETH